MYARAFFYVYLLLPCITDRPSSTQTFKLRPFDILALSLAVGISNDLDLKVCIDE